MGKYFEALKRGVPEEVNVEMQAADSVSAATPNVVDELPDKALTSPETIIQLPVVLDMPTLLARNHSLQTLNEKVAPMAAIDSSIRIIVSGCRHGDGTSSIAFALAIDFSQRLEIRTLLVGNQLRNPAFYTLSSRREVRPVDNLLGGLVRIQATGRPQLDVASFCSPDSGSQFNQSFEPFEQLIKDYRAVIVDLGVVRLESRLLPLARPGDPILLVVRYGHTERQELESTTTGLRAAKRPPAGVILNAAANPTNSVLRRFLKR